MAIGLVTFVFLFSAKEEIRSSDPPKFLGCLSFLFQVFAIVRDNKGVPLEPLLAPVVIGLEMLLDEKSSNDEISCAASHVSMFCIANECYCRYSSVLD
jgi:hypothetical protein